MDSWRELQGTLDATRWSDLIPSHAKNAYLLDDWWGGKVGPYHLLLLGFFAMMFSTKAICKDLHWRLLLLPGGLHPRRFGWQILGSSLAMQWVCWLALATVWLVVSWAVFNVPFARDFEVAWKYRVLPLEVLFAICLGVVLRALGRPVVTYLIESGLLLLFGGIAWWNYGWHGEPKWFSVDLDYVSILLAASVTLALLSNWVWTPKKLLPFTQMG